MKAYPKKFLRAWLLPLVVLSGLTLVGGCTCGSFAGRGQHLVNKCPDIEPGALPQPNGSFVKAFQDVQATKAEADDFVIYTNEWFMGETELGPFGQNHLKRIAIRLPKEPVPVVIQESFNPELDQIRQRKVVDALASAGIPDAHLRVIVGPPAALDLDGNEGPRIYRQMLVPQNYGYGNNMGRFGGLGGLGGWGGMGGWGGGGFGFFGGGLGGGNFFGY